MAHNSITLQQWSASDLPVLERSNTPEMTVYLGGPESPQKLADRQAKFLHLWETGEARMFTVHTAGETDAVGSIGYWTATWHDTPVFETGWSIATAYQGRGLASGALSECLNYAAENGDRDSVLAFPRIDNEASNALCRRVGFDFQGVEDFEYPKGNPIRVKTWLFDLGAIR